MTRKAQLMRSASRPSVELPCRHLGRFENEPLGSLM